MLVTPLQPTPIMKYKPFAISFVFSLAMVIAYIVVIVMMVDKCLNACIKDYYFYYTCISGTTVYCCSGDTTYSNPICSYYEYCYAANYSCGSYIIWSWVTGSLVVVGVVLMIISACIHRKQRNAFFVQNAYNNMNQGYQPYNPTYPQGNQGYQPGNQGYQPYNQGNNQNQGYNQGNNANQGYQQNTSANNLGYRPPENGRA